MTCYPPELLAESDRDLLRECGQPTWTAYVHSRSRPWPKFKCTASQELVIGGFTEPNSGKHASGREITWVRPRFVGEFGFTEWTSAGKLSHPRFLGLRRDKDPRKVLRESRGHTS